MDDVDITIVQRRLTARRTFRLIGRLTLPNFAVQTIDTHKYRSHLTHFTLNEGGSSAQNLQ